jgi:hypothetical protein
MKQQRWYIVDRNGYMAAGPYLYKPMGCPFGIGMSMPSGFVAITEERYESLKKKRAKSKKQYRG